MLIFGGQDGSTYYNDVWEFDPATKSWNDPLAHVDQPASALPAARYGAAACLDDSGHLLISHGISNTAQYDDTWQFDLALSQWTDLSPAPGDKRPAKRGLLHGAWDIVKRRLLVFDGQSAGTPFLDDLWGWSPEIAWQQIARNPHPSPRNLYALVYDAKGARVLVFGGKTQDGPHQTICGSTTSTERTGQAGRRPGGGAPSWGANRRRRNGRQRYDGQHAGDMAIAKVGLAGRTNISAPCDVFASLRYRRPRRQEAARPFDDLYGTSMHLAGDLTIAERFVRFQGSWAPDTTTRRPHHYAILSDYEAFSDGVFAIATSGLHQPVDQPWGLRVAGRLLAPALRRLSAAVTQRSHPVACPPQIQRLS